MHLRTWLNRTFLLAGVFTIALASSGCDVAVGVGVGYGYPGAWGGPYGGGYIGGPVYR
jgi:hypothetical protein